MGTSGMWRRVLPAALAATVLVAFLPGHGVETGTVEIGGESFRVELATDEAERRQGLMHREQLPPGTGMLFIYKQPQPVRFWNKDVRFPIDILYFDAGRRLVRFDADVPPCPEADCPVYETKEPVQYVLELPDGTAERLQLKRGSLMQFR